MDNINVAPAFVLAGEATFTVSNGRGDHHTFHVYKATPSIQFPGDSWFIKKLTGPDNTSVDDYAYLGMVIPSLSKPPMIKVTGRSRFEEGSEAVKIARWALKAIWQAANGIYVLPPPYSIKHVGRCGKCGAILTHPASLDTGLGPECAAQLGVSWRERPGVIIGEAANEESRAVAGAGRDRQDDQKG